VCFFLPTLGLRGNKNSKEDEQPSK